MNRKIAVAMLPIAAAMAVSGGLGAIVMHGVAQSAQQEHPRVTPAETIELPDGYSPVATTCDGPNRIYVTKDDTRAASAITVVPDDLRCTERTQP